jgi:hypothetical protein
MPTAKISLRKLIKKGYFPEELPPPFNTNNLADYCTEIADDLLIGVFTDKPNNSKHGTYSIPRIKSYRRTIGIPNPLHYVRLCDCIVSNWNDIQKHCEASEISMSRISPKFGTKRAVPDPDFNAVTNQRILRSTGYRYCLRIDISRFYGSIYTHSIPWAIHTKESAKAVRGSSLYGNDLDKHTRNLQDAQTIGIPIGPDSSRIISETILATIDQALAKALPYLKGIRIVDDYTLYFKSLGDLEVGRSIIQKQLKEFELELNHNKENIVELPEVIDNIWFNELREFEFRNVEKSQRKDIIAYFDKALIYARQFPEEFVLTYAIAKLQATVFRKSNWTILQSLLLNTLQLESKVLRSVAAIFIKYHQAGYPIDNELVTKTLEEFIAFHLELDNDFEISWALWLMNTLELEISSALSSPISKCKNPIVILIALDISDAGGFHTNPDTKNWEKLLTKENLYSEYWLVAYETVFKKWLTPKTDYISKDPFFNFLFTNDVSFYDNKIELDISKVRTAISKSSIEVTTDAGDYGDLLDLDLDEEGFAKFDRGGSREHGKTDEEFEYDEPLDDLPF